MSVHCQENQHCEKYAVYNAHFFGASLSATVWPEKFSNIQLQLPDNNSLRDSIFGVVIHSSNPAPNTSSQWPQPSLFHTL